ncbi:hypothetical protein L198_04759 [Cryptococcus wingfieldii CBS 7118]|uniref:Uncharacterized protein n=1 Tax=Cryptococcus wingfieldii CBS 7118 TaxID=1295528 RepID=A0A1E3J3D7_9TREE|nr:hypothetical protein L198_04759 [Cryptococcus wingfieldii CBS 7118]ODN95363.1 hypothetical protein L198_04759 [Cryptococcus wingfieldii CBS 7118]
MPPRRRAKKQPSAEAAPHPPPAPMGPTSLEALYPVHDILLDLFFDMKPFVFMRLSKMHRAYALRRMSKAVVFSSDLRERLRDTIDARPKTQIDVSFLIPIFFAHTMVFDSMQTFGLLAADMSIVERAKRLRKRPGSPYPFHPARLFEHVRRIQLPMEPFVGAYVACLDATQVQSEDGKCRGLRQSDLGYQLGDHFSQVSFMVQPLSEPLFDDSNFDNEDWDWELEYHTKWMKILLGEDVEAAEVAFEVGKQVEAVIVVDLQPTSLPGQSSSTQLDLLPAALQDFVDFRQLTLVFCNLSSGSDKSFTPKVLDEISDVIAVIVRHRFWWLTCSCYSRLGGLPPIRVQLDHFELVKEKVLGEVGSPIEGETHWAINRREKVKEYLIKSTVFEMVDVDLLGALVDVDGETLRGGGSV